MKETLVINLIGGPCSGKSTIAAELFARLKKMGIKTELVSEYIKDEVPAETARFKFYEIDTVQVKGKTQGGSQCHQDESDKEHHLVRAVDGEEIQGRGEEGRQRNRERHGIEGVQEQGDAEGECCERVCVPRMVSG